MTDGIFAKHNRKYWYIVLGGMLVIGIVNVLLGYLVWEPEAPQPPPRAFPRPAQSGTRNDWPAVALPDAGATPAAQPQADVPSPAAVPMQPVPTSGVPNDVPPQAVAPALP